LIEETVGRLSGARLTLLPQRATAALDRRLSLHHATFIPVSVFDNPALLHVNPEY
jgi:hypothetical protein